MAGHDRHASIVRDGNGLTMLTPAERYEFLGGVTLGRVAFIELGLPRIVPVNFSLLGDDIEVPTGTGAKLRAAIGRSTLAVEADGVNPITASGWTTARPTATSADLVVRGYSGLEFHDDALWFDPQLPQEVERIHFGMLYRGQQINVHIAKFELRPRLEPCATSPIEVDVQGARRTLVAGGTTSYPIDGLRPSRSQDP
jgi:hypothetical protein